MPKISELTPASTLAGTETLPVVQSGETRKASVTNLGTFIFSPYAINTFPARASTGSLEPKPISDYGLSLVNAANANAALLSIGAQPSDATLSALAVYNANGLFTQTALDTFVARTITGTTNRITVTNGSGVLGNPTIDIASGYVAAVGNGGTGLSSLTTGNYINAASSSTMQQRTPAQVRSDLTLATGTYTPTVSATTNVDSTTPKLTNWTRNNDMVTVSGYLDVDTTAAASTSTSLQLSLPVASDFAAIEDCGGSGAGNSVNEAVFIAGNIANNTAVLNWLSASTGVRAISFHFTYRVR